MRILLVLVLVGLWPAVLKSQTKPDKDYLVYVLSEGADKVSLVRFGPEGLRLDHQIETGDMRKRRSDRC